jgi:alcohol dehydrogenase class IV
MQFDFATANRIIFGAGKVRDAGRLAKEMGRRALVVTGRDSNRAQPLLAALEAEGLAHVTFSVATEPTTELVESGVRVAKDAACDIVLAIGGGSALDAGKVIAAMMTNHGELSDYLEVIGQGKSLTQPPVPCIAIPTTAGTGTEVTRNAVLLSPAHRVKVSMRSPFLLPRVALVDPELTHSLPPAVTAHTGMDALTQLIEPFTSPRANPLTDAIACEGISRIARSLRRAFEHGDDTAAREDMALASLFGGLALANAGLGAVHGFAGPLGGMFPAPHGALCAPLLPHTMEINVRALAARAPDNSALARYETVARILTGNSAASVADGVAWIKETCRVLRIPPLSTYRVTPTDIPVIVKKAAAANSMRTNPIALTPDEMTEILRRAL